MDISVLYFKGYFLLKITRFLAVLRDTKTGSWAFVIDGCINEQLYCSCLSTVERDAGVIRVLFIMHLKPVVDEDVNMYPGQKTVMWITRGTFMCDWGRYDSEVPYLLLTMREKY